MAVCTFLKGVIIVMAGGVFLNDLNLWVIRVKSSCSYVDFCREYLYISS